MPASGSQHAALCLSGGGFRALLWHLGSLQALNAQGRLAGLCTISGVSAGAVVAAWLGMQWSRLEFDRSGRAGNLEEAVLSPLRAFAQLRLGVAAVAASWLPPLGLANRLLEHELDKHLFKGAMLSHLTDRPLIRIAAVDLQTAEALGFSARGLQHARFGECALPDTRLASAVAASCAFTPFIAPAVLPLREPGWPARLYLGDGVLQDNLGLEAVVDSHELVFLSDASLPRKYASPLVASWHSLLLHAQRVQFHHARLSRLRLLTAGFGNGSLGGAYWALGGQVLATSSKGLVQEEQPLDPRLARTAASFLRLPADIQQALEQGAITLAARALACCGTTESD